MKQVPTRKIKVAAALTDPHPLFVSLVDHGANQIPFNVVKAAGIAQTEERGNAGTPPTQSEDDMPQNVDLRKIQFDQAVFGTEEAVRAYLTSAGIEAEVKSEDGAYVVDTGDLDGVELVEIEAEKGVTYFVHKSAEEAADGEAPEEETTKGAKTHSFLGDGLTMADVVQKYDSYFASFSGGKNITEVLRMGADGLPIGIFELNDAMYTALRNNLIAGDYDGATAVIEEFGKLVVKVAKALEAATVSLDVVEKALKDAPEGADEGTESPQSADVEKGEAVEEEASKDAETTDGEKATDAAPEGAEGEAEQAAKEQPQQDSGIAALLKGISDTVNGLRETVEATTKSQTERMDALEEKVSKTAEAVEEAEASRTQTRKGADASEATTGETTPTEQRKSGVTDPLIGNTLGFRRIDP
jgi:hypothetical protein